MAGQNDIRAVIDRIVSEVLEARLIEIRAEVLERAVQELEPMVKGGGQEAAQQASALLNDAVSKVQASVTQAEVLAALLDGAEQFAERVALFVVRGDAGLAWQARGFADNNAAKTIKIDMTSGVAERAVQRRESQNVTPKEFNADLVKKAGSPVGNAFVLPLLVRDKVPALLYADAGPQGGQLDASALQVLVRTTGLWLEVVAGRRGSAAVSNQPQAPAEPMIAPTEREREKAVPAARRPEPPVAPAERVRESAATLTSAAARTATVSANGDEELHNKARRFAKLLVEEIKLYNQAKVAEGRRNHDLYDRLRDDIEKSRTTYHKRYGAQLGGNEYFTQELIRTLADNDASLLGRSFAR